MPCQFKNMFGDPGKGLHKFRFMNIAIVDVVATIFLAKLISDKMDLKLNVYEIFILLIILSIILHRLFCVRTTVDKWLFKN